MANDVRIRATVNDQVSGKLTKIRDNFDHLGKSAGFKALAQGVGMGAGIGAWNLLTDAASGAVHMLGDAVGAALEDERSVAKLTTALKANVQGFDGHTKAIEDAISARIRLGYSDDEQRDSLAKLVAVTKNSTEALRLQRVAMDVARLRGIDLATAGDLLGKVYGGNVSILRRYGIQVDKNATSAEALAAVERLAAGQAEAYANTTEGKLLGAQLKFNEAMEQLGYKLLPAAAEAADVLSRALEPAAVSTADLLEAATNGSQSAAARLNSMGGAAKVAADNVEKLKASAAPDLTTVKAKIEDVADAAGDMKDAAKSATQRTADYFKTLREQLVDDTGVLIDDVFDPIEKKLEAEGNHFRILSDIQERESAKGKEAINSANQSIVSDLDDQAQTLLDLGKRGKLTKKQVEQFADDAKAAFASMGKKVPKDIQRVIDKLNALEGFDGNHIRIGIDISQRFGIGGKAAGKKHAGGFVGTTRGATLTDVGWMGEAGTEAYAILRNPKKLTGNNLGGLGGSSTITVNVMSAGVLTPGQGQAIAREIGPYLRDYTARRG